MSQLANIPTAVRSKLAQLRRAVMTWIVIDGGAKLCLWLVGVIFVSLLIDRSLRLDVAERAVLLVIGLGVLGTVIYRRIVRPLSRALDDDALIVRVERENPELADRLISAVQFARIRDRAEETGVSKQLVDATIDDGGRAAGGIDFGAVINTPARNRNLIQAGVAILLLVAAFAIRPDLMGLWLQRNVLLSAEPWPRSVDLTVMGADDGVLYFPRGDDLTLRVLVEKTSEKQPPAVEIAYRFEDGPRGTEAAARSEDDDGQVIFSTTFTNVLSPLSIRARGLDGDTGWVDVKLVERPAVQTLDLVLDQPDYTGTDRVTLDPAEASYYVLNGSSLIISGQANKPLAWAHIAMPARSISVPIDDAAPTTAQVALDLPTDLVHGEYDLSVRRAAGGDGEARRSIDRLTFEIDRNDTGGLVIKPVARPRLVEITGSVGEPGGGAAAYTFQEKQTIPATGDETIPLRLAIASDTPLEDVKIIRAKEKRQARLQGEDGFTLTLGPGELVSGSYAIDLADDTGPDGTANLLSKRPRRFAVRVVPDREPSVRARLDGVGDKIVSRAMVPLEVKLSDDFRVVRAVLAYREEAFTEDAPPPTVITLPELDSVLPTGEPITQRVVFDVEPLDMAVDAHLQFDIIAIDNDTVTGDAQPAFDGTVGKTNTHGFTLRIVTEEELRKDLLTREQQFRQDFMQQYRRQQQLLDETTIVRNQLAEGEATDESRRELIRLEKNQRLTGNRVEAIADQFSGIVEEVINNRLEDEEGPVRRRLELSVIMPLREMAGTDGTIDRAANALDRGRERFNDQTYVLRQIDQAIVQQKKTLKDMQSTLAAMANAELFQSAVNMARQVLDQQKRVKRDTEREHEQKVEDAGVLD